MPGLVEAGLMPPDFLHRINRARLALMLSVPPHVIDEMPANDAWDVIEVNNYDVEQQKKR